MTPSTIGAKRLPPDWDGTERRVEDDRRAYSIRSLWHCFSSPRRMNGRRAADRHFPLLDRFDSGIACMAGLLMLLSVMDAGFTLTLISRGGSEVNPFMNWVLNYGVWAFTMVKMLLTAVPALLLVATCNLLVFKRIRVRSLLAGFVGIYIGLIMYELMLLSQSSAVVPH